MSGQYSLEPEEIEQIKKILNNHNIELSSQDIMGKDFWNEVKIHICEEGTGFNVYIQVD